jgi:hypothetical protein
MARWPTLSIWVFLCLIFVSLGNKEEYTCWRCDRENQLKQDLNKLRSAQTIINILQNELILAKASMTTCTVNRPHRDEPNSDADIEVWKLAAYNNIVKSQKRTKSVRSERAAYSYSVSTANRFSPLSNLVNGAYVAPQRIHKTTNIQSKYNKILTIVIGICLPSELQCTTSKQK